MKVVCVWKITFPGWKLAAFSPWLIQLGGGRSGEASLPPSNSGCRPWLTLPNHTWTRFDSIWCLEVAVMPFLQSLYVLCMCLFSWVIRILLKPFFVCVVQECSSYLQKFTIVEQQGLCGGPFPDCTLPLQFLYLFSPAAASQKSYVGSHSWVELNSYKRKGHSYSLKVPIPRAWEFSHSPEPSKPYVSFVFL